MSPSEYARHLEIKFHSRGTVTCVSRETGEPIARPRRGRQDAVDRCGRSHKIDIKRAKERQQLRKYVRVETPIFVSPKPRDAVCFDVSLGKFFSHLQIKESA